MQQRKLLTITIQFHFPEGLYFGRFGLWSLGSPPLCTDLSGSQSHPQIQGLMLTLPMLGQGHGPGPTSDTLGRGEWDTYLLPATVASPEVTVVSPVSILKVVVLPAPFTPRRPKH